MHAGFYSLASSAAALCANYWVQSSAGKLYLSHNHLQAARRRQRSTFSALSMHCVNLCKSRLHAPRGASPDGDHDQCAAKQKSRVVHPNAAKKQERLDSRPRQKLLPYQPSDQP